MKKLVIEKDKLSENIRNIVSHAEPVRVIAVLKGNGYGLGLIPFAQILLDNGVDFFAVAGLEEALALRAAGFTNEILLLSSTSVYDDCRAIAENNITATIGSFEAIDALEAAAKDTGAEIKAHLKLDTGFGRYGFLPSLDTRLTDRLGAMEGICLAGVFTHLSFSFGKERKAVDRQHESFRQCLDFLSSQGINPPLKHISNSCAFLRYDELKYDAVRAGSAFLGRLPILPKLKLHKIGVLKANITEVKLLPKGHNIGYANTFKTKRPTKIAIVPVGYMDGYGTDRRQDTFRLRDIARSMLNLLIIKKPAASVNGTSVPLLGRVGMYNITLDITGTDAKIGDEVILPCNTILLDSGVERVYE